MQICRGFSSTQWPNLKDRLVKGGLVSGDQEAWNLAVDVFERRMRERFFNCIEVLIISDSRSDVDVPHEASRTTLPNDHGKTITVPGFAIMGLCCLLIDTLQSFREVAPPTTPHAGPCKYPHGPCIQPVGPPTTDAFKKFLRLPAFGHEFDDETVAASFVRGVRNGIFHEAETRRWAVWRDEPVGRIVCSEGRGYAVNRTEFYVALKSEFDSYLLQLRTGTGPQLRQRFAKKMNDLVREC